MGNPLAPKPRILLVKTGLLESKYSLFTLVPPELRQELRRDGSVAEISCPPLIAIPLEQCGLAEWEIDAVKTPPPDARVAREDLIWGCALESFTYSLERGSTDQIEQFINALVSICSRRSRTGVFCTNLFTCVNTLREGSRKCRTARMNILATLSTLWLSKCPLAYDVWLNCRLYLTNAEDAIRDLMDWFRLEYSSLDEECTDDQPDSWQVLEEECLQTLRLNRMLDFLDRKLCLALVEELCLDYVVFELHDKTIGLNLTSYLLLRLLAHGRISVQLIANLKKLHFLDEVRALCGHLFTKSLALATSGMALNALLRLAETTWRPLHLRKGLCIEPITGRFVTDLDLCLRGQTLFCQDEIFARALIVFVQVTGSEEARQFGITAPWVPLPHSEDHLTVRYWEMKSQGKMTHDAIMEELGAGVVQYYGSREASSSNGLCAVIRRYFSYMPCIGR